MSRGKFIFQITAFSNFFKVTTNVLENKDFLIFCSNFMTKFSPDVYNYKSNIVQLLQVN